MGNVSRLRQLNAARLAASVASRRQQKNDAHGSGLCPHCRKAIYNIHIVSAPYDGVTINPVAERDNEWSQIESAGGDKD